MAQLKQTQKTQIRKTLENKIGRSFEDGVHGQILREVKFRDYESSEGEDGTVIKAIIEGSDLDIKGIQEIEGVKILRVTHKDIKGYRDGFEVQLSNHRLKKEVEK